MPDSTYYVTLPNAGVTAEVTASSTRQARTVYLDYLTRSGVVPWRGRTDLRTEIIIDRIDPGQIPTDIQLSYGQQPIEEEEYELNGSYNGYEDLGPDYSDDPYGNGNGSYETAPVPRTYQNGSFGGAERQVRSEWDQTGAPSYEEELPTYAPQRSQVPLGNPIPSPGAKPNKLPGLAPGQKISMTSQGTKAGDPMNLSGESKVAKLVKSLYTRGKV